MAKPRILIVDDNNAFLELFAFLPEAEPFDIIPAPSARDAIDILNREPIHLIVSDIQMPEMNGIELFSKVQQQHPEIPVILITAFGSTEEAVQAVRQGAFHYFEKPIDDKFPLFWTTVREGLEKGNMQREIARLQKERELGPKPLTAIIGRSSAIRNVVQAVEEVAPLAVTVLISGETGTGKELVARAIYEKSDRHAKSFFAVSCGEFASGVLESELFGHEKGAFTGAHDQRKGLFEIAHQGTLFLDEINDAPTELQAKLLRVLESKHFTRVGSSTPLSSDFRVLAATNQNLKACVAEGRFRKDLFYRLNVYEIELPPLRQRKEDLALLADFYLKRFSQAYNREIDGFSESALVALRTYDWPGNVRELINVVERAAITCKNTVVTTRHLPFDVSTREDRSDLNLKDMTQFYIELALRRTSGNRTKACELLGISRKTLIEKIKKYHLEKMPEDRDKKLY